CPLVICKEKDFVLDDRPTDGTAELIPAQRQCLSGGPILRVEIVIPQIFERRAVEIVASRFRRGLQNGSRDGAKLGIVVAGGDLEFLQGIDVRVDDRNAENRTVIFSSIKQKSVGRELLPVGGNLDSSLGILRRRVLPVIDLGAGRDQ